MGRLRLMGSARPPVLFRHPAPAIAAFPAAQESHILLRRWRRVLRRGSDAAMLLPRRTFAPLVVEHIADG